MRCQNQKWAKPGLARQPFARFAAGLAEQFERPPGLAFKSAGRIAGMGVSAGKQDHEPVGRVQAAQPNP